MNLMFGREDVCLFSLGWGNHWESSIGETVWETSITSWETSITSWETSVRKTSMDTSIRKTSTKTGIRKSSIRNTSSNNWGSSKRSRSSNFVHWGGSLLGGKTSSSSIIKSSLESSLGNSNLFSISNICSSNLSSLGICIHWSKSSMFSSFSSSKSSIELSLGCSNISGILNWEGSGKSQKGSNDQFIHVCACSREFSE